MRTFKYLAFAAALLTTASMYQTPATAGPAPNPAAQSGFDWQGFYIGGHIGGAASGGTQLFEVLPVGVAPAGSNLVPLSQSLNATSAVGGVHTGYNWLIGAQWLGGLEADWSGLRATSRMSAPWINYGGYLFPDSYGRTGRTVEWVSSIRGRAGYLIAPATLIYLTGGAAWAGANYTGAGYNYGMYGDYVTALASSKVVNGFVLGGGAEWAFARNWLWRVEYFYYQFGSFAGTVDAPGYVGLPSRFSWSDQSLHVVRAGVSYKF